MSYTSELVVIVVSAGVGVGVQMYEARRICESGMAGAHHSAEAVSSADIPRYDRMYEVVRVKHECTERCSMLTSASIVEAFVYQVALQQI